MISNEKFSEMQIWLKSIEYRDWKLALEWGRGCPDVDHCFLHIDAGLMPDRNANGATDIHVLAKVELPLYEAMSRGHFISLVDSKILDVVRHEHYEFFRVDGTLWEDPH